MSYHFQSPDPPNPNLDLAFHSFYVVQINTFPPATTGRFSPEEKKFLSHADGIVIRKITSNVGAKLGKGKTADDCFVRLRSSVPPLVFAIESTDRDEYLSLKKKKVSSLPSGQHFNEVLLSRANLFALTQPGKDTILLQQRAASSALDLQHFLMTDLWSWRNDIEIKVFAKDNDSGTILEHIPRGVLHRVGDFQIW